MAVSSDVPWVGRVSLDQLCPAQGHPGHPAAPGHPQPVCCDSGSYVSCHQLNLKFSSISIRLKTHPNENEVILKVQRSLFPFFFFSLLPKLPQKLTTGSLFHGQEQIFLWQCHL